MRKYYSFDKFILLTYLIFLLFYLYILFFFKSSFFVIDENRFYAQEFILNFQKEGFLKYSFRKENESLPLIQRLVFIAYYKIFGSINLRIFYLYSLAFVFGICHLFYIYFKTLNLKNILILPVFLFIFSLNHFVILWCTANYFLPTFFFSLLLFHLLVQNSNSSLLIFLVSLLVPFGTANGIIALVLAIAYVTYIKNFKLLFGFLFILCFQYLIFFKFTYQSNSSPISKSIISAIENPFHFLELFLAQIGVFSVIFDSYLFKVSIAAILGFIILFFAAILFVRVYFFKTTSLTEKWISLTLTYLILSILAISIQRHQGRTIVEVLGVTWYMLFSYLILSSIYILFLKYTNRFINLKQNWWIIIFLSFLMYTLQLRNGIKNIFYLRNMGESNKFNFIHNNYVDENDKFRTSSNSIKKLIEQNIYNIKPSKQFSFLYDDYSKKKIFKKAESTKIYLQSNQNKYESDSLFKSDIFNVEIYNVNKKENPDLNSTFLLLLGENGEKWMFYPQIQKKSTPEFLKSFLTGEIFINNVGYTFSLSGIKWGRYKVFLTSINGLTPITNIKVLKKY